MGNSTKYLVIQHLPDLFRQEPRNVGVVVAQGVNLAARFFGESNVGAPLDGRKLRAFQYPDVYRQWVNYWRRTLAQGASALDELVQTSGQHFRVIEGGRLSDTGGDSIEDIANYAYSVLVSEGGLAEALGAGQDAEVGLTVLNNEISAELSQAQILTAEDSGGLRFVRHPVIRGATVQGKAAEPHRPSFMQHNGALYLMETVDFTTSQRARTRDHAGLVAYMFSDIRGSAKHGRVETRTVVRLRPEDEQEDPVRYALAILRNESDVVNWLDPEARKRFIEERVDVAHSS